MKKIYFTHFKNFAMPLGLLFSILSSICFAQEKLSNTSNVSSSSVNPKIYIQLITDEKTPITNTPQLKSGSPQFIQKFSQDKSPLSQQSKIQVKKQNFPEQVFQQGMLPTEKSGLKSASNVTTVFCNDFPIGTSDIYVAPNDKVLSVAAPGFLANDIDPDGDAVTATLIADGVDHGSLSAFPDGSFTYTPSPGYIGTDQFKYRMRDPEFNASEDITVTIEVREAGNRIPLGSNDAFGALTGTILSIAAPGFLANDIDQDGDVLTATLIADGVDHGSLSAFPDGSFSYTPTPGYIGTDQFKYRMRDSEFNASEDITVTIQVYEGNRKPLGTNDLFGVVQNTTCSIPAPGFLINDIDPDRDALTATLIADGVDHGSLSAFPDGSFTYTPTSGYTGTDQFKYRMRDSEFNASEDITVILEVIGTGVLPVGFADAYKTAVGSDLSVAAPGFLLNDIDQNGESLTATLIADGVDHGSLSAFPDGSFTYTPTPGYIGTDQFKYRMRDASFNESEDITVTIEVGEAFNRTPVGSDDLFAALANTSLVIASPGFLANDIDQDGDMLTATLIADGVDHGSLVAFPDGSFTYTPIPGYIGTDQFKYRMRDSEFNASEDITVTIQVYEGNRNPLGTNDAFAVVKNTTLTIAASGFLMNDYDPDGDALTATLIADGVDHGSLVAFPDGSFAYTPTPGYIGTDQFKYRMRDPEFNESEDITVIFDVIGLNEPPVASADNITTECTGPSGTTVTLDGSASTDTDGGALTYTWYENNTIIAGPTSSATSEVIFSTGIHTVTLEVKDECGQSSETDISVYVEDLTGPLVEAELLPAGQANYFEISCSAEDVCSEVVSSVSVIKIPGLVNPKVSYKNQSGYSISIDIIKNVVSVKAPNAAAFWATILSNGGVIVDDGQVISAKYDKNKFKFSFDAVGNLISVEGNVVTLQCKATDGNGNTGISEATLPPNMLKSAEISASYANEEISTALHRNYPNPFDRMTTIEYRLEKPAFVNIAVFDQTGRLIKELASKQMPTGMHKINWDATQNKPGIYFYRIEFDGNQLSNKMILLRP